MEYAKKGFSSKVQHTENTFLGDTTLLKRLNLWIFNKNRESALYEVLPGQGCNQSIVGIWNEKKNNTWDLKSTSLIWMSEKKKQ